MMSVGVSTSGMVGPDALGAALLAFAGAKGTKAGLWYDNRRLWERDANLSCRVISFGASSRSALLPDTSGVAIAGAFGGFKGTKGGLWCDSRRRGTSGTDGIAFARFNTPKGGLWQDRRRAGTLDGTLACRLISILFPTGLGSWILIGLAGICGLSSGEMVEIYGVICGALG